MRVSTIMTASPTTIDHAEPVARAIEIMESLHIRHLPVMDGERLVGILSDRDLRSHRPPSDVATENLAESMDLMERAVGRVCVRDPRCVDETASGLEALDVMLEHRIGSVCVLRGDVLVGILTQVDVLRAARPALVEAWRLGA